MRQFYFLLAPSHHHLPMNLCYSFLLLLLVLSGFSESLQHAKPHDFLYTRVTVCSSAQLGVLAPVLPQNEVYRFIPPHSEVYKPNPPQNEVYKTILPQNKALTSSEMLNKTLNGAFNYFLPPNGVFKIITADFQLFNNMKTTIEIVLNLGVKGTVQFRCKLNALLLKQCFFKKHDFAVCLYKLYHGYPNLCFHHLRVFSVCLRKLYHGYRNLCFQHLGVFSADKNVSLSQINEHFKKSN